MRRAGRGRAFFPWLEKAAAPTKNCSRGIYSGGGRGWKCSGVGLGGKHAPQSLGNVINYTHALRARPALISRPPPWKLHHIFQQRQNEGAACDTPKCFFLFFLPPEKHFVKRDVSLMRNDRDLRWKGNKMKPAKPPRQRPKSPYN